ncbi:YhgE/Pip domain-containing protein [Microbacterium sp. GXF7504]
MKRLWTLVTAPARGQRRWQVALALVLVAIAPFVVVATLAPQEEGASAAPVALVNLDVPVQEDGTYVAVGKLLTQNLVSADAVDWVLTDTATAEAGLASGDYLAVVTIPEDFSQTATTLGSDAPKASTLTVTTSTAHGYLGGVVAQALASAVPAGVSAELTQQFVAGTLSAFSALNSGIGTAAEGADMIAGGLGQARDGAQLLAEGSAALADGLGTMEQVLATLPESARGLGALTAAGAATSGELALELLGRSAEAAVIDLGQDDTIAKLDALIARIDADPTAEASTLLADLDTIRQHAAEIDHALAGQAAALAKDAGTAGEVAVGAAGIAAISGPVADGLGQLAQAADAAAAGAGQIAGGNEGLAGGLGQLTDGSASLAEGLTQAADSIPAYTTDQQQDIATVVAQPITVDTTNEGGPSTALASSLAALAPIAQWLGAIATFLLVAPFARGALTTAAPARRIAGDGMLVVTAVAVVQALLVWGVLLFADLPADRVALAGGFAVLMALSFAFVHQALVAFLPRAGLIVSIAFLGLQIAAAGTISPQALTPAAAGPLAILPLSVALQGTQDLVGGAVSGVLAAAIGLALWAVIGLLGTIVAVHRARTRSLSMRELARV